MMAMARGWRRRPGAGVFSRPLAWTHSGSDAAVPGPPRFAPGIVLAKRFRILRLLGWGGMGEVYAARDLELKQDIALKVLHSGGEMRPEMLARLKNEIRTARLVHHAHVRRIYDLATEVRADGEPVHFFTMELLQGESLAERLQRQQRLPPAEARRWLREIAAGLEAVHAAGIVHGDLKPGNVLLHQGAGPQPMAVIADFGLAHHPGPAPAEARPVGSMDYMAPEQLAGDALTPAADVYAFGLLAYELMTGRAAFSGEWGGLVRRLAAPAASLLASAPELDPVWSAIIAGCLAREPEQRFRDGGELLARIGRRRSDLAPQATLPRRLARLWNAHAMVKVMLVGVAVFPSHSITSKSFQKPILLTPLVNATGDPQLDAVTGVFAGQMARARHLYPLRSGSDSTNLAAQPVAARARAVSGGAHLVVFGTLHRLAGSYHLDLEMERMGDRPDQIVQHWEWEQVASDRAGLDATLSRASAWVDHIAANAPTPDPRGSRP